MRQIQNKKINIRNKKINSSVTSPLGLAIKQAEGVTGFSEKKSEVATKLSTETFIGAFTFNGRNMNYIIITSGFLCFINFRMTIQHKKSELPENLKSEVEILEHINNQNSKTVGIKTFISSETEDEYSISVNSEYVLDSKDKNYSYVPHVINILSISPGLVQINKTEGK